MGFRARQKLLLNLKSNQSKTAGASGAEEPALLEGTFEKAVLGAQVWRRSWGSRRGLGEPKPPSPGWAGEKGGGWKQERAGLGSEGPSPPGAAGLGLGRDCEFSPPPPPPQGFNKRSPRRLPPPGPERAAVRARQLPSSPPPAPFPTTSALAAAGSPAGSPGVRPRRPPRGPGRRPSGGAGPAARHPASGPPAPRPVGRLGVGGLNWRRRDLTPEKDLRKKTEETWRKRLIKSGGGS